MSVRAIHGDCLDVLPTLGPVDAVVTDPPYGLEFMGVAWDTFKARPKGRSRPRNEWGDFGSREHPRSPAENGVVAAKKARAFEAFSAEWAGAAFDVLRPGGYLLAFGGTRTWHRLACAIEDAGFVIQDTIAWVYGSGFPKNKTLLKPSFEPIVMAYKPGGKRELQIDECRIGTGGDKGDWPITKRHHNDVTYTFAPVLTDKTSGRWPANLCHDSSDEVLALFPMTTSGKPVGTRKAAHHFGTEERGTELTGFGDTGSAARFFFSAKAGAEDRWGSRHPTVKPVALMKWLVQLVTPLRGIVLDPFAGSGTTGVAALATGRNAIMIERESNWFADIQERIAFYEGEGRHSLQAKARGIATPRGAMPLFEAPL